MRSQLEDSVKLIIAAILLLASPMVFATTTVTSATVLQNCYSTDRAEFFTSDLEDILAAKSEPLLLLDEASNVVGVISVQPKRESKYPYRSTEVAVEGLSLCSSLTVDSFLYPSGSTANLLNWLKPGTEPLEITQDEGMIRLNVAVEREEDYSTKIKVVFAAYDVFTEDVEAGKGEPGFLSGWGLPQSQGTFYFYVPKNWMLVQP
jgi:hypothetical protein